MNSGGRGGGYNRGGDRGDSYCDHHGGHTVDWYGDRHDGDCSGDHVGHDGHASDGRTK